MAKHKDQFYVFNQSVISLYVSVITATKGYVESQFKIYLNNFLFFAGMYFPVIDSQYQREEDKNHVLAYNKWMYF